MKDSKDESSNFIEKGTLILEQKNFKKGHSFWDEGSTIIGPHAHVKYMPNYMEYNLILRNYFIVISYLIQRLCVIDACYGLPLSL